MFQSNRNLPILLHRRATSKISKDRHLTNIPEGLTNETCSVAIDISLCVIRLNVKIALPFAKKVIPRASFSNCINLMHASTSYGKVDVDEVMRSAGNEHRRLGKKQLKYLFDHGRTRR